MKFVSVLSLIAVLSGNTQATPVTEEAQLPVCHY